MKRALIVLFVAAALGSATAECSDKKKVRLGEPFTIKVKQKVSVKGANLKIKFTSVANDSRCPEDVQCIWQGNAEVNLKAGTSQTITLNTGTPPNEVEVGEFTIKLLRLTPRPRQGVAIPTSDYEATLVVSKR